MQLFLIGSLTISWSYIFVSSLSCWHILSHYFKVSCLNVFNSLSYHFLLVSISRDKQINLFLLYFWDGWYLEIYFMWQWAWKVHFHKSMFAATCICNDISRVSQIPAVTCPVAMTSVESRNENKPIIILGAYVYYAFILVWYLYPVHLLPQYFLHCPVFRILSNIN